MRHLPPESATARAQDPDWHWWRAEHDYLAAIIEVIDVWGRAFVRTQATKGIDFGEPLRLPRPGDAKPKREVAASDELTAFLSRGR